LSRPKVYDRIQAELDEVVGSGPITAEAVQALRYLDAVIQESTRMRPASAISAFREVLQHFELQGYTVQPGWAIAHSFPVMSRRADLFPEPDRFRPERFMNRTPEPYHWSPFGGGSRVCAGRGVAQVELKVVLATILRRRRLKLVDPEVGITRSGQFIAPTGGLRVVAVI
ncbi:MAG: cytochrome P450, partial [Acidobacteriota bacterium]